MSDESESECSGQSCCSSQPDKVRQRRSRKPKNEEVDDDAQKAASKAKSLSFFFLLLFVLPAVLPFAIQAFSMVATSNLGIRLGLYKTPKMRLVDFYKEHNPKKLKQKNFIQGTLRKWRGREDKLFE
eukprot:Ihof_evm7s108 gene=Ihof_evmTU7s108